MKVNKSLNHGEAHNNAASQAGKLESIFKYMSAPTTYQISPPLTLSFVALRKKTSTPSSFTYSRLSATLNADEGGPLGTYFTSRASPPTTPTFLSTSPIPPQYFPTYPSVSALIDPGFPFPLLFPRVLSFFPFLRPPSWETPVPRS